MTTQEIANQVHAYHMQILAGKMVPNPGLYEFIGANIDLANQYMQGYVVAEALGFQTDAAGQVHMTFNGGVK